MGWVVLDPDSKWEPKPYNPTAYADDFKRGVEAGNLYWAKQQGWFSTFFHQWVSLPMSRPQDVAFLAGMFTSWLGKAILALGLGEMRHARNLKKNANAPLFATMTACVGSDVWERINKTPYLDHNRGHYRSGEHQWLWVQNYVERFHLTWTNLTLFIKQKKVMKRQHLKDYYLQ